MIDNLSSAAALYLAPILSLTSFLMSLFVFLAPSVMLHKQVALLVVSPSSSLTSPNQANSPSVDGPSLFLGLLGSCGQTNNAVTLNCTTPSFSPIYNTTVLPNNSNPDVLSALPASAPVFILISLLVITLFFILFTTISIGGRFGKLAKLNGPMGTRASAWLGLIGFMIGLTSYLVLRLWYGKMADDFNMGIAKQGNNGPQLIASISNGFTMIWVAHAFAAVPLVCAMTKLHVTALGGPGKA